MDIRIPEINQVMIAGRMTRDPELRFTQKQQGVVSLSVAVNRRYQDQASGEWKDDTTFVPVTVWGPAAERCKEKMKKGSPVLDADGQENPKDATSAYAIELATIQAIVDPKRYPAAMKRLQAKRAAGFLTTEECAQLESLCIRKTQLESTEAA